LSPLDNEFLKVTKAKQDSKIYIFSCLGPSTIWFIPLLMMANPLAWQKFKRKYVKGKIKHIKG